MEKIKSLFLKKKKTTRWNWIFRIGVILLSIGIVFTFLALIFTMSANIENFTVFESAPNDASVVCGIIASAVAVTGMFFLFCGKIEKK